jgi:hypothetical protein
MNKIKYTNLLLSIIALGIIGINIHLFKDKLISVAHAFEYHSHSAFEIIGLENHTHRSYDIYGLEDHTHDVEYHEHDTYAIYDLKSKIEDVIEDCDISGTYISC